MSDVRSTDLVVRLRLRSNDKGTGPLNREAAGEIERLMDLLGHVYRQAQAIPEAGPIRALLARGLPNG